MTKIGKKWPILNEKRLKRRTNDFTKSAHSSQLVSLVWQEKNENENNCDVSIPCRDGGKLVPQSAHKSCQLSTALICCVLH